MRLAMDVQSTVGRKTGIGYYTKNLLAGLCKFKDIEVLPFSSAGDFDMGTLRRMFWENVRIPAMISQKKPDILHIPGFAGPKFRGGCSKVTTVCDLIGMIYPENLGKISRFYWQKWLPECVRRSDAIIAISEHTKKDIIELLGVPEEKIYVTLLASDPVFHPITDGDRIEEVSSKYGLPDNFVFTLGTIEPRKNIPRLVKAFSDYVEGSDTDLCLVISGKKDWGYGEVLKVVDARKTASRVFFTGYVKEEDMPVLYSMAKFFVYPSIYEGFGLPVLEALSCGSPVISSNTSSLPEVAGTAAIFVDPKDVDSLREGIARLDKDENLRKMLSREALSQSEKFSWEKTAARTVDVYNMVMGRRL